MRYIEKRLENEPESLRKYRSTPGATYNNCNRTDIRKALLKEQGYLCAYCTPLDKMVLDTESTETNTEYTECFPLIIRPLCDSVSSRRTLCPEKCLVVCAYCMRRISETVDAKGLPSMQIKHFVAQADNEELRLNFLNMLGVCDGNRGNPKKMLHCDQSRGKEPLRIDPRNFEIVSRIKFSSSGKIRSDDEGIQNDLDYVLNLNIKRLKDWRREAIDTAKERLNRKYKRKGGTFSNRDLKQEIRAWETLENGKYRPFCQAAIYYLKNKLSRL